MCSFSTEQSATNERNDIFVGNLAFSTTEEQLQTIFSEVGKLVKIRMVTDSDTGKPRGFAFVEYEDPQAALSAIRNLNGYELNGRQIRVNFSNSSHLETLAGKLGMDMQGATSHKSNTSNQPQQSFIDDGGAQAVADALKSLTKSEMYDVISQLKAVADRDPDEARRLLCAHPQLPEAVLYLMSKLDMVQTSLPASTLATGGGLNVVQQQKQTIRVDPRLKATVPTGAPTDPRAAMRAANPPVMPSDPRAAAIRTDPRLAMQQQSAKIPIPPTQPPRQQPPPPIQSNPVPQQHQQLDPNLKQQVMSLTEQQIAALPPEKQQGLLSLRQKIMAGLV